MPDVTAGYERFPDLIAVFWAYLLKVGYIMSKYPNVARFLILETLCLGRSKTLTYV